MQPARRTIDVSVVIPTFNRPHFLSETVQAVLAQTVSPREVIVVDNSTNDDTAHWMDQVQDLRVVYVRIPPLGPQAARNAGIKKAQGEWIATLDDDDLWRPDLLETVEPAMRDARVDALFSDHHKFNGPASAPVWHPFSNAANAPAGYWDGLVREGENWSFAGKFPPERILMFNAFYPSTMLARKALISRLGGYDPKVRGIKAEDMEFLSRLIPAANLAVVHKMLVDYRLHDTNASGGNYTAQAVGRWRIFEYVARNNRHGSEAFQLALEADLPGRRVRLYDRIWRKGLFEVTRELEPLMRPRDWTLARKAKRTIQNLPEPVRGVVLALTQAPKAILARLSPQIHSRLVDAAGPGAMLPKFKGHGGANVRQSDRSEHHLVSVRSCPGHRAL